MDRAFRRKASGTLLALVVPLSGQRGLAEYMTAVKTLNSLYLAAFLPIFSEYGTLSTARAFAWFLFTHAEAV
jgi:hypothetical protein